MLKQQIRSSTKPPPSTCTIIVRFSGLDVGHVRSAVTKLQAELKSKLTEENWASDPLCKYISKLTTEQVCKNIFLLV